MFPFVRRKTTRQAEDHFVSGWRTRLAACIAGTFIGAFGYGCGESEADEESIACCRLQMMCDNCLCSVSLAEIGDNGDEVACEAALEDDDIADGCSAYGGSEAILDCS